MICPKCGEEIDMKDWVIIKGVDFTRGGGIEIGVNVINGHEEKVCEKK